MYNGFQDALDIAGEVLTQGPIARYDGTAGCVCLVYLREAVKISNMGSTWDESTEGAVKVWIKGLDQSIELTGVFFGRICR